jgi:hypothetical protein
LVHGLEGEFSCTDVFLEVLALLGHLHESLRVLAAHGHAVHGAFVLVGLHPAGVAGSPLIQILHALIIIANIAS